MVVLQLLGPLGVVGVLLASIYAFYLIAFKTKIDLIQLFILLIPNIALSSGRDIKGGNLNQYGDVTYFKILIPSLTSVYIFGPIAVSVMLFMALAVPVRLFRKIKIQKANLLHLIWFIVLLLSIYELYLAKSEGIESAGGLTVGLRMVLSIGAILIPLAIGKNNLEKQLILIGKISMILFLIGVMNSHWIFVTAAFPAFIFYTSKRLEWKIISVICALIFLIFGGTFTIKFTTLLSWSMIFLFEYRQIIFPYFKFKLFRIALFLLPMLIVYYVIESKSAITLSGRTTLQARFISKLYGDRGGIWMQTIEFIKKSNFFIVPAGRNIIVYDYGIVGESDWGAGAHNIYLEMARQIGLFSALLLSIIIFWYLFKIMRQIFKTGIISKFILISLSVYIVFGLTGNDLVYDGIGFLFWLIIGQIYQVNKIDYTNLKGMSIKYKTHKLNNFGRKMDLTYGSL